MATSYAWHPGSGSVNSRWAVPVPLLPDEIVSSWLVRAALVQGCDPLVLTGEVWPKWRIWTQDADRLHADDRLEPLVPLSGITKEILGAASLFPIASRIYGGNPPGNAVWSWMLATGAINTKRHGGIQYCPSCLAEDAKPYFRLQWRFAWHTSCEKHGSVLRDRCHVCNATVEYHRLQAEDGNVAVCATCKADLRNSSTNPCAADALAFQRAADDALRHGRSYFHDQTITTHEWFELAGFFVSMLRRACRSGAGSVSDFLHRLEVQLPDGLLSVSGGGIETLRTDGRQKLLMFLGQIMVSERESFESALLASGLSLQGFSAEHGKLPMLLTKIATSLPDKHRSHPRKAARALSGPCPRHEVVRMMSRLQNKLERLQR